MRKQGCKKWALYVPQLVALLLVFNLNLNATAFSQHQRLNLKLKDATLEEFISAIKRQCDVGFIYDYNKTKDLKGITVTAVNEEISAVLEQALRGTGFTAEIDNNTIILRKSAVPQTVQVAKRISGQVMDKSGNALPGVTVMIKGTALGTTTGVNGDFEISLPNPVGQTLVFSFIGMTSVEMTLKNTEPLTVVLKEEATEMEEVVITGIYSRKKESFTGSSQTYTHKELKMIGNTNVLQSLKTIDPSFAIIENNQFGSDPNTLPDINVRGKTSVVGLTQEYDTDPNQPLFILDGFESTLKAISNLSMDRVASITVLKDAAATAIYGSKAANGVIVVETKAPEAGKLQVNYNGNLNFSFADLSDYNLMNAREKLAFEKLAGRYGPLDANGEIIDEGYQSTYYQRLAEVEKGVDSYWLNEPLRFATSHSHDLFIEGGDSRMRYGLGVNYNRTAGVMKGSDNNVLNGNVRLIYRYKNLAFTDYVNFDYSVSDREKVAFSKFSQANPYYRKVNDYGEPEAVLEKYKLMSGDEYVFNPLYDMSLNSSNRTRNFGFRNNFEVDWRVIEPLRLRARISVSKSVSKQEVFQSPKASVFYGKSEKEKGSYSETNGDVLSYDGDLNATFGKLFDNKHMVNAVVGMQVSDNKNKTSGFRAIGYVDDRNITPTFSNGYPSGEKPSYSNSQKRSASYYMNGGYAYDNRYLLDANFRADGSSVFGVSNKFTTTWAVGVGWNIHNESFVKNCAFIDFLKLRYSIGNPGNQNFSLYMSSNMYSYTTSFNNPFGLGARISSYGNPNLEWQKTIDQNFGFDVEIFHRRLRLNFDYFMKNTDPLLVSVTLPTSTGTASVPTNLGKQTTKGYTLSANVVVLQKEELNWSINGNLRHLKYEYKNIGNALEKYNAQNRKDETVYAAHERYGKDTIEIMGQDYRAKEVKKAPCNGQLASYMSSVYYIVFPDEAAVEQIAERIPYQYDDCFNELRSYYGIDIDGDADQQKELYKKIQTYPSANMSSFSVENRNVNEKSLNALYGGLFFTGAFLGVLFMIATVLIIYYKQLSEGYDDRKRFHIMQQVGMTHEEVSSAIRSQVLMVFFMPLVAACIHTCFAFPMIRRMLSLFNMRNTALLAGCMVGCFVVFGIIYVLVYLMTARTYNRIVQE